MRSLLVRPLARALSSQASASLVGVAVNDSTGVATLTLQRDPVNSINLELGQALLKAIKDLEKNRARGIILTSAQPTVFSAGLDILEMYKPDPERVKAFWTTLQDLWLALYGSSAPTAAAINGHSPAGGCLLACSCEYRIMVDNPKYSIGLNETKLGIVAPPWFISTYLSVLPRRDAERALIAGRLFKVAEAHEAGLVDELATDKDDAVAKATAWLSQFANVSPAARSMTKQITRGEGLEWLRRNREADLQAFIGLVMSKPVQNNLAAYMEALKNK